jgi:hypothetical protein
VSRQQALSLSVSVAASYLNTTVGLTGFMYVAIFTKRKNWNVHHPHYDQLTFLRRDSCLMAFLSLGYVLRWILTASSLACAAADLYFEVNELLYQCAMSGVS